MQTQKAYTGQSMFRKYQGLCIWLQEDPNPNINFSVELLGKSEQINVKAQEVTTNIITWFVHFLAVWEPYKIVHFQTVSKVTRVSFPQGSNAIKRRREGRLFHEGADRKCHTISSNFSAALLWCSSRHCIGRMQRVSGAVLQQNVIYGRRQGSVSLQVSCVMKYSGFFQPCKNHHFQLADCTKTGEGLNWCPVGHSFPLPDVSHLWSQRCNSVWQKSKIIFEEGFQPRILKCG